MKSLHIGNVAGQTNLKGKKYKLLSCKCCVVRDLRDKERTKEAKKDLNDKMVLQNLWS
jgi:hypothetical protein